MAAGINVLPFPIRGAAYRFHFPLLDASADLVSGGAGDTPDTEISKDDGTFADCTNEMTEIATASGMYYIDLTATEMTADIVGLITKTATAETKTTPAFIYPRRLPVIHSGTAQAGAEGSITLDSGASAKDDAYNGLYALTDDGDCRFIIDYDGGTKIATVGPNFANTPSGTTDFQILVPENAAANIVEALIGSLVALDGGAATVGGMLTKMADDNGGADFDAGTDSLNKIEASIIEGVPHAVAASAQNLTQGTIDSGSYASTALADDTKFQLSPNGALGLDVDMTYPVGLAAVASGVTIEGYWNGPGDFVNIYAWNYLTTSWDQLSDAGTRMNNASSDADYGPFVLLRDHQQDSDGEVKIRFTGDSVTSADDLYLDQVLISAVALGGSTLDDIGNAVVSHNVTGHADPNSLAHHVALLMISAYDVTTGDTATSFTCSALPAIADYYNFHHVRIYDVTNGRFADSWISDMNNAGVVILGRPLPFVPDTASEMYVMNGLVAPSEIQSGLNGPGEIG